MKSCAFTAIGHTAEYIQTAVKAGNFYLQFGSKQKKEKANDTENEKAIYKIYEYRR